MKLNIYYIYIYEIKYILYIYEIIIELKFGKGLSILKNINVVYADV